MTIKTLLVVAIVKWKSSVSFSAGMEDGRRSIIEVEVTGEA